MTAGSEDAGGDSGHHDSGHHHNDHHHNDPPYDIPYIVYGDAPATSKTPPAYSAYSAEIGDIGVTQTQVVTPAGTFPLRGSVWTVTDNVAHGAAHTDVRGGAGDHFVVFCLLGLLFLLMKETRTVGFVQVTVNGGRGGYHLTMVPVSSHRCST
jgi:hypothetical protein